MMVLAAGALGAATTATYFTVPFGPTERETADAEEGGFELCLKNEIVLFEGAPAGCYSRADLAALRDAPVIDRASDTVRVSMSHPSDASVAPSECETCREFSELRWRGWFAKSSRDMRREAYFIRACGVLDLLLEASPAAENHFADGAPSAADMASIGAERVLRVGDDPETDEGALVAERDDPAAWRLATLGQETRIEEIAVADFDRDGVAEILVFLVAGPTDGTATVAEVALLEKDGADSPMILTPQRFTKVGGRAAG